MAGTYEQASIGEACSSGDPKILAQLKGQNEALDTSNKTPASSLSLGNLGRWYTPVEIPKEEERESETFGTLPTPDEVKNVVVPQGGIIVVGYVAKWSATVKGAAAIFLGNTQIRNITSGGAQETNTSGTLVQVLASTTFGLNQAAGETAIPKTGAVVGPGANNSGFTNIFVEAGTYNVSVRYETIGGGKVKAKERRLWVGVIGV
jgi:hypothetical protein